MPDLALAYHEARTKMSDLARSLDDRALTTKVPACPEWTVKDLVGHVAGIATAFATGEGLRDVNLVMIWDPQVAEAREAFIDAEVQARTQTPIDAILKEWEESAETLEAMLRGERPFHETSPPLGEWIVVTDIGVHQHDLRGAVGLPGDRDSLATGLSLRSYVEGMRLRAQVEGRPTFRIVAGSREWTLGDGEPAATVTADPFELARAVAGRRSPEQIRAFGWQGDPEPVLPLFYPYGPRTDALIE